MDYTLPKSVDINGVRYAIRYDYRVVLDIFEAMNDPELSDEEKTIAVLQMFYPDFDEMKSSDFQEAVNRCEWFVNGGKQESKSKKGAKLISWTQDFHNMVSPINRIIGRDIRGDSFDYDPETNAGGLHWFTFLSAFNEIGDCFFAQIVNIRSKKSKGKKLDKHELEFYRANREEIDIKSTFTTAENDLIKMWTGK